MHLHTPIPCPLSPGPSSRTAESSPIRGSMGLYRRSEAPRRSDPDPGVGSLRSRATLSAGLGHTCGPIKLKCGSARRRGRENSAGTPAKHPLDSRWRRALRQRAPRASRPGSPRPLEAVPLCLRLRGHGDLPTARCSGAVRLVAGCRAGNACAPAPAPWSRRTGSGFDLLSQTRWLRARAQQHVPCPNSHSAKITIDSNSPAFGGLGAGRTPQEKSSAERGTRHA